MTSEIYLLSGVPLDSSYKHTIYFTNQSTQLNHFLSKFTQVFHATGCSYLRPERDVIKLQGSINKAMYNSNYAIIRNPSHENKYFYCFVNRVRYINDNTFEIDYSIDFLQTYMCDVVFNSCYVKRCHSATDSIDGNLQPEPINPVQPYTRLDEYNYINEIKWVIDTTRDLSGGYHLSAFSDGEIQGCYRNEFFDVNSAINFISQYFNDGKVSEILSITAVPVENTTELSITRPISFGGGTYYPANKKCLSSLFQNILCIDGQGNSKEFYFDFARNGTFVAYPIFNNVGEQNVMLVPKNYKGIANNYPESLIKSAFPKFDVPYSDYNEWLRTHQYQLLGDVATTTLSTVESLAVGNYQGAIGSVSGLAVRQLKQNDLLTTGGMKSGRGSTIGLASNIRGFRFYVMQTTVEDIKRIDNFFNCFGYTQNIVLTPNPNNRPRWYYIETQNCSVSGTLPNEAKQAFNNALNGGITFWHTNTNVCDYSADNRV